MQTHKLTGRITEEGAILEIQLYQDPAWRAAEAVQTGRKRAGVKGRALIDTASRTVCATKEIINELGLKQVGKVPSRTVWGDTERRLFAGQVVIETPDGANAFDLHVLEVDALPHGFIGIVGRDILAQGVFVYDGPKGEWAISLPVD